MNQKSIVLILGAVLACSIDQNAAGQSRTTPRPSATPRASATPPAPAQPVGPLSVGQVLEALYSLGVTRTEDLVAKSKVRFEGTPEILGILKEFGATDRLLSFIPTPPPPTPPPAPKVAGPLSVTCEPVDCTVIANDKYRGATKDHMMVVDNLSPGEVVLQAFSNGFETGTQKLVLQEGKAAEARFELATTVETRQRMGQQNLLEAIQAIGGIEAMSLYLEFQGDGTLDWDDDKGQRQNGSLKFSKKPGNDIEMELRTKDGGVCTGLISGRTAKQSCRGGLKGSEATIDEAANLFLKYEVRNLVAELLARTSTLSGSDAKHTIEASDRSASYTLTLNADQLPSELVHTTAGKPDAPVTVVYSDYVNLNGGKYPAKMEIHSTDKPPVLIFALKGITTRLLKKP